MSEQTYCARVQQQLGALVPSTRSIALGQLIYARGLDDQLATISRVWILVVEGRDAAGVARWFRDSRWREAHDMRRAGSAADASTLADEDPAAASLLVWEYEAAATAAGWATPAAPATIGQEPALPVAQAARTSRRGLRTVQTRMRGACRAELGGQGVLPGMPTAGAVYRARSLGAGV